jgi:senataxin
LLQGPPGTGKTTTLMGLLAAEYEYLKNICGSDEKRKILICAPSNAAINHITKRLVCEGLVSSQSANFSTDGSNQ